MATKAKAKKKTAAKSATKSLPIRKDHANKVKGGVVMGQEQLS
jgi:hypothetical protein